MVYYIWEVYNICTHHTCTIVDMGSGNEEGVDTKNGQFEGTEEVEDGGDGNCSVADEEGVKGIGSGGGHLGDDQSALQEHILYR
jgi:hypothetical protein